MSVSVYRKDAFAEPPAAVLFDIDNTLYPYAPAHEAATADVSHKVEQLLTVPAAEFRAAFAEARRQIKQRLGPTASSHSRLLYFQRMLELLGLKTQALLALDLEQTYWRAFLKNARLFDGVSELLDDLRIHGIPTAMVSDLTAQIQFRKLVYFGLEHTFDFVVTSEEAGIDKPAEMPFALALEKLEIEEGSRVWMIGDNPEADIAGAKRTIGASTLMKRHAPHPERIDDVAPDLIFDSFVELRKFVQPLLSAGPYRVSA